MKTYFKIQHLLLLLLLMVSSVWSFSCELHEGGYGFGGSMPGRFNTWHPYSPGANQARVADSSNSWLTLTTPTMVSAKLNDEIEISVDYQKTMQIENLHLKLEAIPGILVVNITQTEIDSESGRYTFTVIPAKAGTFRLTTIANADQQGHAKAMRETIYLNVKVPS